MVIWRPEKISEAPEYFFQSRVCRHDLKETIDKDYCECGMPLETVRESEAPLKERSERV